MCSHLIVQNGVRLPALAAKDAGYFFILTMFYLGAVSDVEGSHTYYVQIPFCY